MSLELLPSEPRLSVKRKLNCGGIKYEALLAGGRNGLLRANYDPTNDIFNIDHVETNTPRRGVGKQLLGLALNLGLESGAEVITATIVKRQCLDSAKIIFGEDPIRVENTGNYDRKDTVAFLNYYPEYDYTQSPQ